MPPLEIMPVALALSCEDIALTIMVPSLIMLPYRLLKEIPSASASSSKDVAVTLMLPLLVIEP